MIFGRIMHESMEMENHPETIPTMYLAILGISGRKIQPRRIREDKTKTIMKTRSIPILSITLIACARIVSSV